MAKVTGPLMSMSASGKLGNALVYFGWKGINVVRQWIIPTNPKTADQGDVRLVLGGMGQATRCAGLTSLFTDDAKLCNPSSQTWVSYLVQYIIKNVMPNATDYETEYTAYAAHTAKTDFDTAAAALELADFDIDYKGTSHEFFAGMQLYELARYGIAMLALKEGVFNRTPYTVTLADWVATQVTALQTDLTNV